MSQNVLERRRQRIRTKLKLVANGRPRLSVHRTNLHIYAQIIDDAKAITLVSASTVEKDLRSASGSNKAAAEKVGKLLAERAQKAGVTDVVFDRSGFLYHGRVKALAEAARSGGLSF